MERSGVDHGPESISRAASPASSVDPVMGHFGVLFAHVQDDLALLMLELAEEGRDEELHRNHGAEATPIAGRGFRTLRERNRIT